MTAGVGGGMFLGLDLGTSAVKAVLIDAEQHVVASNSAPLEVSRPRSGWSEQHPDAWISAAGNALDALKAQQGRALAAVEGIGLSGQMHGATLIDDSGKALRPAILWNDTRSHEEAAALDSMPEFRAISGNIVFPGFTAPKLVWVKNNEPEVFARIHKVLLPKDYLRLWLTGETVSEMSDASGTSWLDTGGRRWSKQLLALGQMDVEQMPSLSEGTSATGKLRKQLVERWGIDGQPIVAGGAGDNAASAIGLGIIEPGSAFVSLGTSGVLFASNERYRPNPESAVHTFCHAVPERWHQMGVILSAADALEWLAGILDLPANETIDAAGDGLRAPGAITFLPYLSGERTPHNDASIRGAFAGIGREADRGDLVRAVLEGVAFALRDNLEALKTAGTDLERVMAVGGGSRSSYWLKIIATVLGIPVDIPAEGEFGAAFGAARLGLVAATNGDPVDICTRPAVAETIEPERGLQPAFEDGWHRFRTLYPAIGALP